LPFTATVLPVPDLDTVEPHWLRAAVSGNRIVVVATDGLHLAAAGIRDVGSDDPFEPLPPLPTDLEHDVDVLDLSDGFAVVGSRCTSSRGDPPEADCLSYQSVVTFVDGSGRASTVRYDRPRDNFAEFTTTGTGTVVASAGPMLFTKERLKPLPDVGTLTCGAGAGEPVLDVRDTSDDPSRPEDTAGSLQPLIYEGRWQAAGPAIAVGDESGRHIGDLPHCAGRVIVIAGRTFSDGRGSSTSPRSATTTATRSWAGQRRGSCCSAAPTRSSSSRPTARKPSSSTIRSTAPSSRRTAPG
jgi:hypothetical protein